MVVNTGVKATRTTDLLILDEIHNYASDVFRNVFTKIFYKYIIVLTATV